MPRHVRKTRRSKKATAKQIEAKRKLSIQAAMKSLIDRGLVVKERPAQAYSLTQRGHEECRRVQGERA